MRTKSSTRRFLGNMSPVCVVHIVPSDAVPVWPCPGPAGCDGGIDGKDADPGAAADNAVPPEWLLLLLLLACCTATVTSCRAWSPEPWLAKPLEEDEAPSPCDGGAGVWIGWLGCSAAIAIVATGGQAGRERWREGESSWLQRTQAGVADQQRQNRAGVCVLLSCRRVVVEDRGWGSSSDTERAGLAHRKRRLRRRSVAKSRRQIRKRRK
jgi:hypothetical protein